MTPKLLLAALLACQQQVAPHSHGHARALARKPGGWIIAAHDGIQLFSAGRGYRFAYPEQAQFLDNGERAYHARLSLGKDSFYATFLMTSDGVFIDENPEPTTEDLPRYHDAVAAGEASPETLRTEVAARLKDFPATYAARVKRWPASPAKIDWSACERAGLAAPPAGEP